jgi:cyclic beta-1,2-glucan synthetase
VSDPAGEVIYLRDEATGEVWSPTPAPMRGGGYDVRHRPGASVFRHVRAGIASELTLGMAAGHALKVAALRLHNEGSEPRRLTLTAYVEWTLGAERDQRQQQVRTSFDDRRGAILAGNSFEPYFADWVAFCALSEPVTGHTGDRAAFIGRNGTLAVPAGLRTRLNGATGAGPDPCAALQCVLELAPGESRDVVVLLGAAAGAREAEALLDRYRAPAQARAAVERSLDEWRRLLSTVVVRTPDRAFDALLNGWSLYQTLACRIWARSALYQSSGGYGFRDQLQDVMACLYAAPGIARDHILHAAGRQFVEGDVQHWWHPHTGRGTRTRFSDDLVWLPYVTEHYARVTGDAAILDEAVPFLTMRALQPEEHEVYDLPAVADETATLYEHCLRALRKASTRGRHGLPLIGGGDWNDGMNRVGVEGRGESVWLGWFLADTMRRFACVAEARGDGGAAEELRALADGYVTALERDGWDGEWYRRAYFDDGTPLGSALGVECRIDAIAQSWSVISGAGAPDRQASALRALERELVDDEARILKLLAPPFDRMPQDPGYIKGYLPGVRENGAQYTHAALWTVLATALRGDGDRAFELFQMLNPLTRTATPDGVASYKVEPYVIPADVYAAEGHVGRGGWTWYTGSASWFYRVGLEAILGLTKRGDTLRIEPRVPAAWPEYGIDYRHGGATYRIVVRRDGAAAGPRVSLDGVALDDDAIPLVDDGGEHAVLVHLPPP